jgi:hypothetical protein
VLAFGAGLIWRRRHDEAERLSTQLDAPDWPLMRIRALRLHALMRLGELGRAEQDLAEIGEQGRASGDVRRRRSPGTHSLTQPFRSLCSGSRRTGSASGRNPEPASRGRAAARVALSASRLPAAGGSAQPERDPGAAVPADQFVGSRNRPRAVGVGDHDPHAHPPPDSSSSVRTGRQRDDHGQPAAGSLFRFHGAAHRLGQAAGYHEPEPDAGPAA